MHRLRSLILVFLLISTTSFAQNYLELSAPDGVDGNGFGSSVAIDGGTAVVAGQCMQGWDPGKHRWDICNDGAKSIYVFTTTSWANGTPTVVQLFGDYPGAQVAVGGDTIVVGVPSARNYKGIAYVFVKPAGGWQRMEPTAVLLPSDSGTYPYFGASLAISGSTIVVGAACNSDCGGPGAAYVYIEPASGWQSTTQTAELTPSTSGNTNFAQDLAIAENGSMILVGQPNSSLCGSEACPPGQVDIYNQPPGGWVNATEDAFVQAANAQPDDDFGACVTSSGDDVAIGSYNGDYIFSLAGASLTQIAQLTFSTRGYSNVIRCPMTFTTDWLFATNGLAARSYGYFEVLAFKEPRDGWRDSAHADAKLQPFGNPDYTADNFGISLGATNKAGGALIVGANDAPGQDGSGCGSCPGPGRAFVYPPQQ
jgi:hypothetical protein